MPRQRKPRLIYLVLLILAEQSCKCIASYLSHLSLPSKYNHIFHIGKQISNVLNIIFLILELDLLPQHIFMVPGSLNYEIDKRSFLSQCCQHYSTCNFAKPSIQWAFNKCLLVKLKQPRSLSKDKQSKNNILQ